MREFGQRQAVEYIMWWFATVGGFNDFEVGRTVNTIAGYSNRASGQNILTCLVGIESLPF
jgi:hypothetical protein